MLVERGVIKVGTEIEIVGWKGRTYQQVCAELVDREYMMGPASRWVAHHNYHCNCIEGGCRQVRSGDLIVPQPLVSMTYDASLPKTGAEFIISPILLAETSFRDQLEEVWNIICRDAEWTMKGKDYHGNSGVSPSIHLHVSANTKPKNELNVKYNRDIIQALSLFSPELFLVADTADLRRGTKFRNPARYYMEEDPHHGFIQVRQTSSSMVYIEWRLIEAAYENWNYIEGCAYLAAALTRAFLDRAAISWLMASGYQNPYDDEAMIRFAAADDTTGVLSLVSLDRLTFLRQLCVEQLSDDRHGMEVVENIFNLAEGKLMKS